MSDLVRKPGCPAPHRLFDLADDSLDRQEAEQLRQHLDGCVACRRLAQKAQRIHSAAMQLSEPSADETLNQTIWESVAPAAERAAHRLTRRNAWGVLLAGPRARLAAAAVMLLLVLGVGASLLLWVRAHPSQPLHQRSTSAGAEVVAPRPKSDPPVVRRGATDARRSSMAIQKASEAGRITTPDSFSVPVRPRWTRNLTSTPVMRHGSMSQRPVPGASAPAATERGGDRLACGAYILQRKGRLRIVNNTIDAASIRLIAGEISLQVPQLASKQSVEVVTEDARVSVRGTRFTVRKNTNGTTTVTVRSGVVWIRPFGRRRRTVVLGPGGHSVVQREAAYLASLVQQLNAAVTAKDMHQAVRLGRRYLAVTTRQRRSTTVRLLLAGALERLGQRAAAAAQYNQVLRGHGNAVTKQNALAFLARLRARSGQRVKARQAWKRMVKQYPKGLHAREALLFIVRIDCRSSSAVVRRYREQLARKYPSDPIVSATLRRCRPRAP